MQYFTLIIHFKFKKKKVRKISENENRMKMTDAQVILEWRNLNLTIEKREFSYLKCSTKFEEKRILDNGKN